MTAASYIERTYREGSAPDNLVTFQVQVDETDLWIAAERDLSREAVSSIGRHRAELEDYISEHPGFVGALMPWSEITPPGSLPRKMAEAAAAAGIGPMAAVAGTIAESVARDLAGKSQTVMVENGGDLYLVGAGDRVVGLWAGPSPVSGRLGVSVTPGGGTAVCTSSATVGPSLSMGRADAATVISPSGALADAVATELGNRVKSAGDVEKALDWALSVIGVLGAVVIFGEVVGAKGQVELVPLVSE
jgi:ApbE superfamily uncharacterized protein (UPF0280 family)